jgi:hypothetical protein
MGFEVHFKFYKKKAEGFGYDTDAEPEVMKVPVGKQWDETDLDELAKTVLGQMAKRNILIVDAEIFEYTKKKISFKMKDDGISIKNRKFNYDITGAIKSEDENSQVQQQNNVSVSPTVNTQAISLPDNLGGLHPHELMRATANATPQSIVPVAPQGDQNIAHLPPEVQAEIIQMRNQNKQQGVNHPSERLRPILPPAGRPLRYEIYDPHPDILRQAQQKRLAFTLNKEYPIFEEKAAGNVMHGMLYVTEDDNGKRILLNDKHFVPKQQLDFVDPKETRANHIRREAVDDNIVNLGNGKVMHLPDIHTLGGGRRR